MRRTIDAGGTSITLRRWGAGNARPLVFWHGLNPFGALQFNEVGPALADRGFDVVAPAAPGLGESPALLDLDGYRLSRLADLVVDVADVLEFSAFDYVGWSWGGSIGMHLATRHHNRLNTLTLLDAGHTDLQDVTAWDDMTLEERIADLEESGSYSFESWDAFFAAMRERAGAWRPALEERFRAGMRERGGRVVPRASSVAVAAAFHWVGVERPSMQLEAVAKSRLPTLLVVATQNDTREQVARFRAALPHAQVIEIDSDHDVFTHAASETARVLDEWLTAQPRVA